MNAISIDCPPSHSTRVPVSEPLAVLAARAGCALEHSIERCTLNSDQTLGHLKVQAARDVQDLLRAAMERGAQAKADATPPFCPVCRQKLTRLSADQPRTFESRYGTITVKRTRGYCKRCHKWRVPADTALGLADSAGYSPAVQEMAALLASKMPVEDASAVLEHLTGVKLPRATLDREARRQGERAQALRTELDRKAALPQPQLELTLEPYQLIIQMDAWNIRERDGWGQSAALRRQGQEPERWHWVYTGTVFRLDHRGHTAGGRPVISERGFVATRQGIDTLREQLHAVQHLAAVGRAIHGEDKEKYRAWLKPLIGQLKNESSIKVIRQLEEALAQMPAGMEAQAVAKEVAYFHEHQARMDYRAGRRAGEPIGSGPVEATCRQTQCRFKQPGQFWSKRGDEALLCLEMFWRNDRWHLLFPHTHFNPARN